MRSRLRPTGRERFSRGIAGLRRRVYEPFFSTKSGGGGSGLGLGLAIVKNLVESIGGQLDFLSEPGVRTVFEIRLPLERRLGK